MKKKIKPQKQQKKRDIDKIISPDDLAKFLNAAKGWTDLMPRSKLDWYLLFYAHAALGTRVQELLLLRWADIDFDAHRVTIPVLKRSKGDSINEIRKLCNGKEIEVHPISMMFDNDELFRLLLETRDKNNSKENKLIFPIVPRTVQLAQKVILKKAGLNPKLSTHAFRHLYGTATYEVTGGDLIKTSIRLRQKDWKSAAKYAHMLEIVDSQIAGKSNKVIFGKNKNDSI